MHQLQDLDKWMTRAQFPSFEPKKEKQFEDYVDTVARIQKKHRLAVAVFQELWEAASSSVVGQVISSVESIDFESLVSAVARELFPESPYFRRLETQLLRLAERWKKDLSISDSRVLEVGDELRLRREPKVCHLAAKYEAEQLRRQAVKRSITPFTFLPAGVEETGTQKEDMEEHVIGARQTFSKCKGCGKDNHTYTKCFFKGYRCNNCRQIGHIAAACTSGVVKDAKGKLQVRMSPKPGGVEIRQYADRTTDQKVESAEGVLQLLRELATHKREKNKLRRDWKREEAGRKPVK
eukprot:GHVS01101237.1.p1 GENE.GHVS01101237.1~~GHVS01101237.1.p1  ORF type:complete len:294 (-),score=34.87 GHVS01101237.1:178-1059(-)